METTSGRNNKRPVSTELHLLFVCCEVNRCVREQPQARSEVSLPKAPQSLMLVDEQKTLPEAPLAVESSHLALYFDHLQGRRGGPAEKPSESDTHEALAPR